jgi:hypothetical protein
MTSPIKHNGREALKQAALKRSLILRWLMAWEITDPHVIGQLLGLARSGVYSTLKNMKKDKLISSMRVSGCPIPVIHLTSAGLSAVHRMAADTDDEGISIDVYPSRIHVRHVQHDLLTQRRCVQWVNNGKNRTVLSARQIWHRKLELCQGIEWNSIKVPDAFLIEGDSWTALEVQETPEKGDIAERKLSVYAECIQRGDVERLIYASSSQGILDRLDRIASGKVRRFSYDRGTKLWYPSADVTDPMQNVVLHHDIVFDNISELARSYYQYVIT